MSKKVIHMTRSFTALVLLALVLVLPGCKVTYSFSGVNISPDVQTFTVQYFPNRAAIVQAQLSQDFTNALIDKITANTSLENIASGGDVEFSGEITGYVTRPVAITGDETAAMNRLTITVRVKYTNYIEPELDFDSSFSRYEDYSSSQNLADVEGELIELIVALMLEDIFNKAFVSW